MRRFENFPRGAFSPIKSALCWGTNNMRTTTATVMFALNCNMIANDKKYAVEERMCNKKQKCINHNRKAIFIRRP